LIALSVSTSGAAALELDTLLPANVPGYAELPDAGSLGSAREYTPFGINYGSLAFLPSLNAGGGYDSDPDGAGRGSATVNLDPSLAAQDEQLGLGAYIAGAFSNYPQAADQNTAGYIFAVGERADLPQETPTVAVALLGTQETGFGFDGFNTAVSKPIGVAVRDIRGNDAIVLDMLTLTPEFSVSDYQFSRDLGEDRTDYRQSITGEFASGSAARLVMRLQTTQSQYRQRIFNANTYGALAGVADQATGLWQIRLLAGAAAREPMAGKSLNAPILEASLGWMPSKIDRVTLNVAREIDDPDQETAGGYTLSEGGISVAHEYLRNVILTGSAKIGHAAYFSSPLVETLFNVLAAINWHFNRALAVDATYAFNDRQANDLAAANEHIITLGLTWTP
jgi:hypothetical protein